MRTNVLAAFFTAAVESASGSIEGMVPFPQAASFVDVGHRPTLAPMRQKERHEERRISGVFCHNARSKIGLPPD